MLELSYYILIFYAPIYLFNISFILSHDLSVNPFKIWLTFSFFLCYLRNSTYLKQDINNIIIFMMRTYIASIKEELNEREKIIFQENSSSVPGIYYPVEHFRMHSCPGNNNYHGY